VPPDDPEDDRPPPLTVLINPEVEALGPATEEDWEGCLSVPGLRGLVPRYSRIRYTGLGPDGGRIDRLAEDFHARVVQHECDHLDGILYPQRMPDLGKLVFQSELRHYLEPPEHLAEAAE
jgi:peptide deformylase